MIGDSVRSCVEEGKAVFYDAEHFFDGYAADRDYALRRLRAAAEAGAADVILCDTNGGTLPAEVAAAVRRRARGAGRDVALGIHTHNDGECAVANSLAAVEAGARPGAGHDQRLRRALRQREPVSIIPSLEIKLGFALHRRRSASRASARSRTRRPRSATCSPTPTPPYVGRSAFAHKGGMHVAGMQADARTFEHIDPGVVGNTPHACWSRSCPAGRRCARRRPSSASSSTPRASTARWSA